jgi:hypothetical protein
MSWITSFFGQNGVAASDLREQILSEVDIVECIDAHMKWKGRLHSYLNGTSQEQLDAAEISREDQCALGKWIHGIAPDYFQNDESFLKLCSDHAYFHLIAGSVVRKVQENDLEESESLLKNEYVRASREVIQDLTELGKHLHREA